MFIFQAEDKCIAVYQLVAEPSKFVIRQTLGLRDYGASSGFLDYSSICRELRPWQNYTDEKQEYCFKSIKTHVCTVKRICTLRSAKVKA